MLWQPALPDKYTQMSDNQLADAIMARKAELGSDLVILGHHYQQDGVIQFADFDGDSFKLSQLAAQKVQEVGAKYVVFCGVHFMAETADILTPSKEAGDDSDVQVILPDMGAGCSMADMADYDQTQDCWDQLHDVFADAGENVRVIPVCYMNCTAAIKAFCGMHGGAVCTSSNCDKIFDWALTGGDTPLQEGEQVKILFLPDQHLGRNTGAQAGFDPMTQMCLWDPKHDMGGNDEQQILDSTFILWKGHCSVHKLFRPEHVDEVRAEWPDVTVIAHPECAYELCQKADMTGSTEGIIQAIRGAEEGSRWAIATEVHLVNRLVNEAKQRGVHARILSSCQCLCTTMYRIDMPHLLWVLDNLAEGKVVNRISVHPDARKHAITALQRMLDITAKAKPSAIKKNPASA
ncbi:MAG: quinolinate synthase NadA [Phycisphaeraceae bacterium]|nr:quinolinate synthase NadA [Phycisphaeraceae bacterium]